jgi:replicative DNA helicase
MSEDKRKKARENLYDLLSEESLISHACHNLQLLADHHDVIKTLTGERQTLASAVYELASAGEPLSDDSLRLHGCDDKIRGLFAKLSPIIPASSSGKVMDALRDVAARREVATAAADAFSKATEGSEKALGAIEDLERATSQARLLLQGKETLGGVHHVGDLTEVIEELQWRSQNPGKVRGLRFGFPIIENMIDGFKPAQVYLIGARPAVGKTALAGQIAVNLAEEGVGCLFFSCEMSKVQLQQRLLATKTGVNPAKSLKGAINKGEMTALGNGLRAMKAWPLWIDDSDRINIELLRSRARLAVAKDGVKAIFVDYVGLVRGVDPKSRMSKKDEIGEVSAALKALSKELAVPVIVLAQLRRSGHAYSGPNSQTEIPRPNLESLKDSGDLEQDADVVILLHRDQSQSEADALAIIAKNRFGGCGEIPLSFHDNTTSFNEKYTS